MCVAPNTVQVIATILYKTLGLSNAFIKKYIIRIKGIIEYKRFFIYFLRKSAVINIPPLHSILIILIITFLDYTHYPKRVMHN